MAVETTAYPVQFEVDDVAPQNRLSILFRWLLVIPHLIVLNFLGLAAGVVILFAWLTIVFVGRFPVGMLRFTIGYARWAARANARSSCRAQSCRPRAHRLTTFFRWFLLVPHLIILSLIGIVVPIVGFAAWLVGVVMGRLPEELHNFLYGYTCWTERVSAYAYLLVDEYPPFSFR